jgi:hypothetical protein
MNTQSTLRRIKRGKLKSVWNEALKEFNTYKLSNRGVWIMVGNPSADYVSKHKMKKITQ